MMNEWSYTKNWPNFWKLVWIVLLMSFVFGFFDMLRTARLFGLIGGLGFVIMFVIRFDDVKKLMDDLE